MTKNYIFAIMLVTLVATAFVNGCARESTSKNLPASGADNSTKNPIVIKAGGATSNVHYDKINGILSFTARTTLADGIELQTQLFRNEEPEIWWPSDRLVQVKDGMWQISVRLGENGVPSALSAEEGYRLEVWEKGNPSHKEQPLYFDLIPPPSPSP